MSLTKASGATELLFILLKYYQTFDSLYFLDLRKINLDIVYKSMCIIKYFENNLDILTS